MIELEKSEMTTNKIWIDDKNHRFPGLTGIYIYYILYIIIKQGWISAIK